MKKRLVAVVAGMSMMLGLAGCGFIPELPEMSQQQEILVTEYAAGLLLKYDTAYETGLLTEEALAKAQEQEELQKAKEERQKELAAEYVAKTEQAQKEKEASKQSAKEAKESEKAQNAGPVSLNDADIMSFVGQNAITLEYKGMETVSSYPKGDGGAFSVDAGNGKELVVVSFKMSNVTSDAVDLDMFNNSTKFGLTLSDGSVLTNCQTLLLDDLSVYRNTLLAGATEDVVILFEVNENTSLSGASLSIKSQGQEGSFGL